MSLSFGAVKHFKADKPGEFSFEVGEVPGTLHARLYGITVFLVQGLSDLAAENPEHIRLVMQSD